MLIRTADDGRSHAKLGKPHMNPVGVQLVNDKAKCESEVHVMPMNAARVGSSS